jgi:hypothetical protein
MPNGVLDMSVAWMFRLCCEEMFAICFVSLYKVINEKINQECYLIFYFIETSFFSLIVHMCILAIHSRFIGCLPLEKSITYI